MKLNKAQYAISEEARLQEELTQKRNECNLMKRKLQASSTLHEDSIKRGEALVEDIDRDNRVQMVEMQKDRIKSDDADVELQYLQDELVNFKERARREMEEAKRVQIAQMQESTLGDETGTEMSSSIRVPKGLSFGANSVYSQNGVQRNSSPLLHE